MLKFSIRCICFRNNCRGMLCQPVVDFTTKFIQRKAFNIVVTSVYLGYQRSAHILNAVTRILTSRKLLRQNSAKNIATTRQKDVYQLLTLSVYCHIGDYDCSKLPAHENHDDLTIHTNKIWIVRRIFFVSNLIWDLLLELLRNRPKLDRKVA